MSLVHLTNSLCTWTGSSCYDYFHFPLCHFLFFAGFPVTHPAPRHLSRLVQLISSPTFSHTLPCIYTCRWGLLLNSFSPICSTFNRLWAQVVHPKLHCLITAYILLGVFDAPGCHTPGNWYFPHTQCHRITRSKGGAVWWGKINISHVHNTIQPLILCFLFRPSPGLAGLTVGDTCLPSSRSVRGSIIPNTSSKITGSRLVGSGNGDRGRGGSPCGSIGQGREGSPTVLFLLSIG